MHGPKWVQFRRLLLGTVVELVQEAGVARPLGAIDISFEPGSAFHVPRLNNHMRFVGAARIDLATAPTEAALSALRTAMERVWPDLLAVLDLPIGDRLTSTHNHTTAEIEDQVLWVRFDLVAD